MPSIRHARAHWSALPVLAMAATTLALAGCGQADAPAPDAPEPEAASPAPEPAGAPEVSFVDLVDGGSYASPLDIVFAVENFNIVPIEDPLTARPGEGHYHLAVDVDCAAAGDVIVAGNPSYIHFGTGNDRISMQFEPGAHRLCLQVADGEHRVIDGPDHSMLTKEIHIEIE